MQNETKDWGVTIVVAVSGNVWVARSVVFDGVFFHLSGARVVRKWGTTTGLNQLTRGPTKETVLDAAAPLVSVLNHAAIALIPCREEDWAGHV